MQLEDFIAFDDIYFKTYDGWDEAPASVWDTQPDESSVPPELMFVGDNPYELMDDFALLGLTREAILAVRGWAAPVENLETLSQEVRPSLHPKKVRVVMYLHLKKGSGTLTVAVHAQGKEVELMDSSGTGNMADAISDALASAKKQLKKNKKGVKA